MASRRSAHLHAAGLVAFGLASSCNWIIGAADYEVETAPAETSRATGSGGCGHGFAPDPELVRACVLLYGCSWLEPGGPLSSCITNAAPTVFGALACALATQDCSVITACRGTGYTTTECSAGQTGWRCDGQKAIYCSPGLPGGGEYQDCDIVGGICDTHASASGIVAGCRITSCTEGSGTLQCNGDLLYECFAGEGFGVDCVKGTSQCVADGSSAACAYIASGSCGTPDEEYCEGDVAFDCQSGRLNRFDCGAHGLRCIKDGFDSYCVAPGCTAGDAKSCKESCDGATANVCVGGAPYQIDCPSFGFSTCETFKSKAPWGDYVKCRP